MYVVELRALNENAVAKMESSIFWLQKTEEQYRVFVSYLEIYNENGYDLLDPKHDVSSLDELP